VPFSAKVADTVDMDFWLELLQNVNVGGLQIDKLKECASNNQITDFNKILTEITSNFNISDLINLRVKAIGVQGNINTTMTIGPATADAAIAVLGIVVVFLAYCVNLPGSFIFTGLMIMFSLLYFQFSNTKRPSGKKTMAPDTIVPADQITKSGKIFMSIANVDVMSRDQANIVARMVDTRNCHVVLSGCEYMLNSYVAICQHDGDMSFLFTTGLGSVGADNHTDFKKEAKQKILELGDRLEDFQMANKDRRTQYTTVANLHDDLTADVQVWVDSLTDLVKDFNVLFVKVKGLLKGGEDEGADESLKESQKVLHTEIGKDVKKYLSKLEKVTSIPVADDEVIDVKDHMQARVDKSLKAANDVMRAICFNAQLDEKSSSQMKDAINKRDASWDKVKKVREDWLKEENARLKLVHELAEIEVQAIMEKNPTTRAYCICKRLLRKTWPGMLEHDWEGTCRRSYCSRPRACLE